MKSLVISAVVVAVVALTAVVLVAADSGHSYPRPVSKPPVSVSRPPTGGSGVSSDSHRTTPTPTPTPDPVKPVDDSFTGVYRFVSVTDGALLATALGSDSQSRFANLPSDVAAALASAKPGDLVNIHGVRVKDKGIQVQTAAVYTPKLGEDAPNVYLFEQQNQLTAGKDTYTAVTVKKYFQTTTFAMPNVKSADGKAAPQEAMMKVVGGLAAGDLVSVDAEALSKPPMLRSISPYGVVQRVLFSKVVRATDAAAGQPAAITGVEVKEGDRTSTLAVDPKAPTAAALATQVAGLKEGQAVLARTLKDDRGTWLVGITPAPKLPDPAAKAVAGN